MRASTADFTASLTPKTHSATDSATTLRKASGTLKTVCLSGLALTLTLGFLAGPAHADRSKRIAIEPVEVYPEPEYHGDRKRIVIEPHRDIDIQVWTNKGHNGKYCVGEAIEIYFRTNRDAYVAIYNTDTRGRTHRIFPNHYDHDNFVRGGKTYRLPARGYDFYVEGPRGRESLKAVAALKKRDLRLGRALPSSYGGKWDGRYDDRYSDRYDDRYDRGDRYDRDDYRSDRYDRKRAERIVVLPDRDTYGVAVDVAKHRVRDGRSCYVRRPNRRPWWH